ncbi:MFS transporter [Galbitalea soli]|uniref:MFS transporter n=1 Tax=Galbitalea soli TaxID=1268042 RepID=A0A7C9PPJ2_9MICO|nr:MFS transporter [Galbitalea soli]NEM92246.1 MFS transporter [Galbitalea soli]NYJ31800.1 putative MFS family arabinose efflux permease [Galbitalea soli]
MTAAAGAKPFPWVGLLALTFAIFVSVTTEFLPTGLLPDMARDFHVSISQVGLLVTIFALTVVVATTPLAILTRNYSRKLLVIVVLLVIAFGAVLAAIAPTYEILVGARIIGGLAHGLFWAVVGAYSGHLVPKHQLGKAVAITAGGGTAAFVLGVPLGTAVGHAFGWRVAFVIMAGLILVLCLFVVKYLPAVNHRVPLATGEIPLPLRKDRSVTPVVLFCVAIVVLIIAQNIFYTYIAPYLIDVAHFDANSVPAMLLIFGGAGAVGLVLAGFVADRYPRAGIVVSFAIVALAVAALAFLHTSAIAVVVASIVWGIAFGGGPAMFQTRILHAASPRFRDTAVALQTTAFNIAIGGGALIGGTLIDHVGIEVLPWVEVAVVIVGVLYIIVSDGALRRRATRMRLA